MGKSLNNPEAKEKVKVHLLNLSGKSKSTPTKSINEPSIKIIPGDTNKLKIINDGKEWNVEELKSKMKKAKEIGKKNEGKEYKNQV